MLPAPFREIILSLVFASGTLLAAASVSDGGDALEVRRDKEKTVYSISGDENAKKEEERDRERAWKMLDSAIIDTRDHRDGKGKDHNR